ncbi:MAG: N-acyl homoserine lactonase family protein [Bacteroidota bacterium]
MSFTDIVTRSLTINQVPIKVHGISTGMVKVKAKYLNARRKGLLAALAFLFDKEFSDWAPIWTWVIEHPEGIFLIDTGENANVNDPGYFKSSGAFSNWLNTTQFKFKIERDEEIDRQLERVGLSVAKLDRVYLTHLHLDHIDGLRHVKDKPVWVNKLEWEKPYADLPKLYPEGWEPQLFPMDTSYANFPKAAFLTQDQNLIALETPGHTHGQTSFLLKTDQGEILIAADVVYYQQQLVDDIYSAANVNFKAAAETYAKLREYTRQQAVVILPSHDIEAGTRLEYMEALSW